MTDAESSQLTEQYTANSRFEMAALTLGVWLLSETLTLRESWNAVKERVHDE